MKINGYSISKEEMLSKFGYSSDNHIQVANIGDSFEFYIITIKEKELITTLFDLTSEKEIEDAITKLKYIEVVWSNENLTLMDLINSWNTVSNKNAVTMIQLLDSFYKASLSSKHDSLSVEDLNTLTTYIASITRESGLIIGNALKSIIARASTEEVIKKLNDKNIVVSKEDSVMNVFDKIKNHIDKITDKEKKIKETLDLSQIIGGNYHIARASAIVSNL